MIIDESSLSMLWKRFKETMTRNVSASSSRPPSRMTSWKDSEPIEQRETRHAAWNAYRSCRDCHNWAHDKDDDLIGCCLAVHRGSFLTPEDYTCNDFVAGGRISDEAAEALENSRDG